MDRNRPLIGITAYEVPASFSHWRDMPAVMVPAALLAVRWSRPAGCRS